MLTITKVFLVSTFFATALCAVAQDEEAPFFPVQNAGSLPTNAVVYEAPTFPGFPGQEGPSASPAPSVDFSALGDLGTVFPPDTHGAVGESNVVTMLNTQVRVQTRTGTVVDTTGLSNFWSSAGSFTRISDPRVLYDPFNKRWIATCITDFQLSTASILLGVSKSENPAFTNWYRSKFDVDASNIVWADQPNIGFNKDWISVQVNLFSNAAPFGVYGSQIWIFTKTNLYAGGNGSPRVGTFTTIGLSQAPALTLDTNTPALYFVQNFSGHFTNTQQIVNTGIP